MSYHKNIKKYQTSIAATAASTVLIVAATATSYGQEKAKFSGYIDVSASRADGNPYFTNGTPARVFDLDSGGATWHQAAFTLSYLPSEGLGGFINVTTGRDAPIINSFGMNSANLFDLTQAYVQFAHGPLTYAFGKFVTLAGAEVISSPSNWNFSRSILFGYAIPFAHTGARVTYVANPTVSYTLGVNNGWDDFRDTNNSKTIEAGISYTASKKLSILAQGYFGKERAGGLVSSGPDGARSLFDVVITYVLNSKSTFILNGDYGTQNNASTATSNGSDQAKWSGVAAYLNHQISPKWRASLRLETFNDTDGYRTGIAQKWSEGTLTLGYLPNPTLEWRLEARTDSSDAPNFSSSAGAGRSSLTSYGLQFLVKF